jgi:hypothetical protein
VRVSLWLSTLACRVNARTESLLRSITTTARRRRPPGSVTVVRRDLPSEIRIALRCPPGSLLQVLVARDGETTTVATALRTTVIARTTGEVTMTGRRREISPRRLHLCRQTPRRRRPQSRSSPNPRWSSTCQRHSPSGTRQPSSKNADAPALPSWPSTVPERPRPGRRRRRIVERRRPPSATACRPSTRQRSDSMSTRPGQLAKSDNVCYTSCKGMLALT